MGIIILNKLISVRPINNKKNNYTFENKETGDFPDGPVAKTP